MKELYRCFLSAAHDTDLSLVKSVLAENNVESYDLYDFSTGDSIQDILKKKLRQADFAVFIVSKDSKNLLYEIGVCEGLGKPSLIIIDKEANLPFYIENRLLLSTSVNDESFIKMAVTGFIDEIKLNKKPVKVKKVNISNETYDTDIKESLNSLLERARLLREDGNGREFEFLVEQIFRAINLKFAENTSSPTKGVDFALWSNKLGRIIGNPIIVETKLGRLNQRTFKQAVVQIQNYAKFSDAKVAILLYLDKIGQRYNLESSLSPLIIAYDVEDFINDLLKSTFENLILTKRNNIAHGH